MDEKDLLSSKLVSKAYDDLLRPAMQTTGKIIDLVPRTIYAVLSPLEKFLFQKEYSLKETQKLLEEKLKDEDPENIQPPEPYVAVPALQAISYCYDNEALRNMYANLLAKAITKQYAHTVHPAFVEVIKQMSPDDAYTISCFKYSKNFPIADIRGYKNFNKDLQMYDNFTLLYSNLFLENSELNDFDRQSLSISSLHRLGLVSISNTTSLATSYSAFKDTELFKKIERRNRCTYEFKEIELSHGSVTLTDFGKAFIEVCI